MIKMEADKCIICGEIIPKGGVLCPKCESDTYGMCERCVHYSGNEDRGFCDVKKTIVPFYSTCKDCRVKET